MLIFTLEILQNYWKWCNLHWNEKLCMTLIKSMIQLANIEHRVMPHLQNINLHTHHCQTPNIWFCTPPWYEFALLMHFIDKFPTSKFVHLKNMSSPLCSLLKCYLQNMNWRLFYSSLPNTKHPPLPLTHEFAAFLPTK